eukprot:298797-Chlamydomonas_euryale.AAC.3
MRAGCMEEKEEKEKERGGGEAAALSERATGAARRVHVRAREIQGRQPASGIRIATGASELSVGACGRGVRLRERGCGRLSAL